MTYNNQSSILEIIRKVLALTTSNHPGEAENAALKAQELMLKYNISLIQLESDNPQTTPSLGEVSHEEIVESLDQKKDAWKAVLIGVVSRGFLCSSLQSSIGFIIVGTEANRIITKELYQWLSEALPKTAREEYRTYKEKGGLYSRRTWSNSFYLGAVYSIRDKLAQQSEELSKGTGLVLASQNSLSLYIEDNFNVRGRGTSPKNFSKVAWQKGYETGKDLDLNVRRQLR